ncbi:MAG: phosphatase PAP2 family protein [Bacteroidota bacterium]|nr:phosphatase PAP2 family protein [Bacteroidota bacterium]
MKINSKTYVLILLILLFSFNSIDLYSQHLYDSIQLIDTTKNKKENVQFYNVGHGVTYAYKRPKGYDFLRFFPSDIKEICVETFQKKNTLKIAAMIGGTTLLVLADQKITDGAVWLGNRLGISRDKNNYNDKTNTAYSNNGQKTLFDFKFSLGSNHFSTSIGVPYDISTAMYFLGDGWTHTAITASFFTYGMISKDNRALSTASQLAEVLVDNAVTTQFLKHITGRESPFTATENGGVWKPFPNQLDYAKHVPRYDAFPSGHVATFMGTLTVIAENYPEYKFIRPVGYSLMGVLAFAMLNNGVHWFSDYPLSIAMGYGFAKIAVNRGRKMVGNEKYTGFLKSVQISPTTIFQSPGVNLTYKIK